MHIAIYLPVVFAAVFGLSAPGFVRRLPPAVATWTLSGGAALFAAGTTVSLVLLSATIVGQWSPVAEIGHWSRPVLRGSDPVSGALAAAACVALVATSLRLLRSAVRHATAVRAAGTLARNVAASTGELVVTADAAAIAYAVPGRPGRIVVSAGLLRVLSAPQRRAVLDHERSHLAHRHHVHHTVCRLSAAANPLLARLPRAVALATERWADETAAASTPRATIADALELVVARPLPHPASSAILAAGDTDVLDRIAAMRAPALRMRWWRIVVVSLLVLATVATSLHAVTDTDQMFDHARHLYNLQSQGSRA